MTELGSDRQLAQIADTAEIGRDARVTRLRDAIEEWRTSHSPQAEDEPGVDHPDPDQAPPADEPHDEYDPTPPDDHG